MPLAKYENLVNDLHVCPNQRAQSIRLIRRGSGTLTGSGLGVRVRSIWRPTLSRALLVETTSVAELRDITILAYYARTPNSAYDDREVQF